MPGCCEKYHQEEGGSPESVEFTTVGRAACSATSYAPPHIVKGGASGWLTVLPLREEGYDMSATQF